MDEFVKWQAYFNRRKNQRDKADWYAASLSNMIARSLGGAKTNIEDHLLNFGEAEREYSPEVSKANWLLALGIKEQ